VRGIVPRHALAEVDRSTLRGDDSARHPVASGPWRIATWDVEQRIVLEPNPRAPEEWRPHLKRIVLRVLPEYSARLLELERGGLDLIAGVEFDDLERLQADPRLRVARTPAAAMQYVGYRLSKAPFDDPRVRRALTLATDRQRLIDDLLTAGDTRYGQPCVGTISPRLGDVVPPDLQPLPFDVEGARALLEEAGWSDGDGDGVREHGGEALRFPLMVQTGEAELKRIAVLLQAQWKAAGVDLQIEMVEPTRFSQRARAGDFAAILWSFGGSPVVDPSIQWRSDGQYNWFGYADPETDRWIDRGLATTSPAEAKAAFQEVQRRVHAAQPATFLFWQDEVVLIDRRFRDTELDSYSSLRHAERWWVPRGEQRY
jgi:peptide/nickel transport system substrate-binding protein